MDEPRVKDSVIQSLPDTNQTPPEEIDSVSPEPELANPDGTSNEGQSGDVSSVPEREPSPDYDDPETWLSARPRGPPSHNANAPKNVKKPGKP